MAAVVSESLGREPSSDDARPLGSIITFYSYKGGTGRTMALANTACVLAERIDPTEKVLVVDWDLEAPGLHQFLPPRLRSRTPALDSGLGADPGLIDLFVARRGGLPDAQPASAEEADGAAARALAQIRIEQFIGDTELPNINIMRAGRNDDGLYSKRVNTFDWEGLFRRAPGIYRMVAQRLARRYRYVLVDSRTGVTDISGICTSLLPEKLVVVFTPNRQSLTGVRELVGRVTSYRLASDDLRPLLVYPLPSRIEVSMEKLNAHWRYGNLDAGVAGYQPMFQTLLKECYDLKVCDLTTYFNDVQIQQSADCAYGEVISVRRTSGERLSLASSYRVFVDRLLAAVPPWQEHAEAPTLPGPSTSASPRVDTHTLAPPTPAAARAPAHTDATVAAGSKEGPSAFSPATRIATTVFLSYAREDRARVSVVAAALQRQGYEVDFDRDLVAGVDFQDAVAAALDASAVVVAFWSKASVASEFVRLEAGEGSRRGVLVPVLLDDTHPPLEFRRYQSVDLRRDIEEGLARLIDDVARVAQRVPAASAAERLPKAAPAAASRGSWRTALWLLAGLFVIVVVMGWFGVQSDVGSVPAPVDPTRAQIPLPTAIPASRLLDVPDFTGRTTDDVRKVADVVGLSLLMTDERHSVEQRYLEGVVVNQTPAAGSKVAPQATIRLTVATRTTSVPSVVGVSLGAALDILQKSGLELGGTQTVEDTGAAAGQVVIQSPQAGTRVPAGTKVNVSVAAMPAQSNRTPNRRVVPAPNREATTR